MKLLQWLVFGILAAGAAHAEEQCLVSYSAGCEMKQEKPASSTPVVNLAVYRAPHSTPGLDSTALISGRHASVHREASVIVPFMRF